MNTCETCKYWKRGEYEDDYRDEGECLKIEGKDGCGTKLAEGELAQAQAGYDWTSVWLQTSKDFGCILHESKDAQGDGGETP